MVADSKMTIGREQPQRAEGRSRFAVWVMLGCVGLSSACAGTAAEGKFPSAREIAAIGDKPPPNHVTVGDVRDVDAWEAKDVPAQPPADAVHSPANAYEKILAKVAEKRQGLVWVSEPMNCLARQFGEFYLSQLGTPNADVTRFLASRCGVIDANVSSSFISQTFTGTPAEREFLDRLTPPTEKMVTEALVSGNQSAGLWYGQDEGRAVVMFVYASRKARFSALPGVAGGDHLLMKGELLTPGDRIEALINDGPFGYKRCTVDSRTRLPAFAIDCPLNPKDDTTSLEIAAFEPGRIMGPLIASLTVWPKGAPPNRYERPAYASSLHGTIDSGLAPTLVSMLNQVRGRAGLPPVTLCEDESRTAVRVAPHFFASAAGLESSEIADMVVLGLRAGWQVPGLIGQGLFTSAISRSTANATPLLVSVLERPSGREALLNPDVRMIAVGPLVSQADRVVAAVFSSYTLLEPTASAKDVDIFVRVLNERRHQKKLPPAFVVPELQAAAAGTARALERGERNPEASLQDLLTKSERVLGPGSQGWFVWGDRLENLQLPDQLTTAPSLRIVVGVARHKPKESPWGGYAVLIAVARPATGNYAVSRPNGHYTQ